MAPFLGLAALRAPNMRVDFSGINNAFDQIGAQRRQNEEKATLADIGNAAATGDYSAAQKLAYQKGRLGVGNQFGQLERQQRMDARGPKGPAPTTLVKNLIAAGYQPGSPEFQKAIRGHMSKPSGTTVHVNNAGETAFAKERGKFQAQRFQQVQEAGDQADLTIGKLNQAEELMNNPNLYTGPGGSMVQGAKSIAKAAGFDVQGQGEGAMLQTITADLGLADLKGFKGATSNKELEFVLKKAPSISNTREGNRLLIGVKKLEQQHLAAKRDLFAQHGGRPPREALGRLNRQTNKALRGYIRQMRKIKVDQPSPVAGMPKGWSVEEN